MLSVSSNDTFTKILVNCSDRVMRLYWIDYSAISNSCKVTTVFKLIDGFHDVINHKRWLNNNFLSLADKTKIVSQHAIQDKIEGQALTTATVNNTERFANCNKEIFVGSIGE